MTWSWENLEDGYMLSTLADPWLLFPMIMALKGIRYPLDWPRWGRLLGIMIKLKDEVSGGVFPNGKISKPTPAQDAHRGLVRLRCEHISRSPRSAHRPHDHRPRQAPG